MSSVTAVVASQATLMMLLMFYEMKLYSDACTYAFIHMNKENMIPVIILVFPMFNGRRLFESPQKIKNKKIKYFFWTKKTPDKPEIRITGVCINEAILYCIFYQNTRIYYCNT